MKEDIEGLYDWSRSEGGSPVVTVRGTIFSHTTFKRSHTTIELKKDLNNCIIREKHVRKSGTHETAWKMVTSPLK